MREESSKLRRLRHEDDEVWHVNEFLKHAFDVLVCLWRFFPIFVKGTISTSLSAHILGIVAHFCSL